MNRLKLDIQRFADGEVIIKSKLDSKQLEKDLNKEYKNLEKFEKEAEKLTEKKLKIEAEIDIKQAEFERKVKEIRQKAKAQKIGLSETRGTDVDRARKIDATAQAKINSLTQQYEQYLEQVDTTINDIDNKIKDNYRNQDKVNKKINEMNEKLGKTNHFGNIKNSVDSIGESIRKTTKKIVKWGLAIFGIRSIYSFIRSSISTISGYDDKIASDVDYIRFALATSMKPIIEWIINGVYEILKAVNYLSIKWFNYNLFQNASVNNFKKMNKSAKELQKTMASFDEMNVLSDNSSTTSMATPSYDLSQTGLDMSNYKAPGWLEWIKDHGKEIGIACGLIIGSSVLGKLSGLAGIIALGGKISAMVIGIELVYNALTGSEVISDLIKIKQEMPGLTKATKDSAELQTEVAGKTANTNKQLKNQAEQYGKNSKQSAIYSNRLQEVIKDTSISIANNEKNIDTVGGLGKVVMWATGTLDDYNQQQGDFKTASTVNKRLLEDTIKEYQELYKQGLLNDNELEDYTNTMKLFGYNLDGTKLKTTQYSAILKQMGFNENEIKNITDKTAYGYYLLSEKLKKVTDTTIKATDSSKKFVTVNDLIKSTNEKVQKTIGNVIKSLINEQGEIDTSKLKTNKFFNSISDFVKKKFNIDITTSLQQPDTNAFKQQLTNLLNKMGFKVQNGSIDILGFKYKIPGLAVGGIINQPGRGVPLGGAIGGESGAEGVIPLTDSQQMELLGEAIGRYITVNLTNVTKLDSRQIARKVDKVQQNNNFVFNR